MKWRELLAQLLEFLLIPTGTSNPFSAVDMVPPPSKPKRD
jgi:hypothetical protein